MVVAALARKVRRIAKKLAEVAGKVGRHNLGMLESPTEQGPVSPSQRRDQPGLDGICTQPRIMGPEVPLPSPSPVPSSKTPTGLQCACY